MAALAVFFVLLNAQLALAQTKVSILHSVIGPKQVPLWIAHEQGLFAKQGIDVQLGLFEGRLPGHRQITGDSPFGALGIPVAIGGGAERRDLKLLVAFSSAGAATAHLVARSGIKTADDLREKRVGVNRIGTGFWIAAVLGLEHLGLDLNRDRISFVEVGGGGLRLVQALEAGEIDAAVLDPAQSTQLRAKGFSLLLDMSTTNIPGIQDALAVAGPYLREHPDVVEKVVAGLVEGIAFSLSPRNKEIVLKTLMARLNISSSPAAEIAYQEALARVNRMPYVSIAAAQRYQRVLGLNDPRVLSVKVEDLLEDRFVRKLDESGAIDRLYRTYGVK
jgi:ABC-type nitrate/sulfonate/bicarbonate transport system substrate-binding protein